MTQTQPAPPLPTPADLAELPPLHYTLPDGCLCATPSAVGCQILRKVQAAWWFEPGPEGEACACACHTNGAWKR